MTGRPPFRALTLAIFPNEQGFGWAAFAGPFTPYDWGTVRVRGEQKNERCLRRIEKLLKRLTPQTLVLEEKPSAARRARTSRLHQAIIALAMSESVDVAVYPFREVQSCFVHLGVRTRSEIAAAIGRQFAAFTHLVPPPRQLWKPHPYRISLFNAVALVLTHYQRDAQNLLHALAR